MARISGNWKYRDLAFLNKAMDGWMVYCTVHSLMALFVLLLILGAIYKAIAICFMGSHFPTVSNKRYSFPTR